MNSSELTIYLNLFTATLV